jgi:hypothetical protein
MKRLDLDDSDRQVLNDILHSLGLRGRKTFTLDGLVTKWQNFVGRVERGYDDNLYEYTNDLSLRDLLDEIERGGTPAVAGLVADKIGASDARFREATSSRDTPLRRQPARITHRWWWSRVPRRLVGELADDLREHQT